MRKTQLLTTTAPIVAGLMMLATTNAAAHPVPFSSPMNATQQTNEVQGTVTDVNGEPIIGASVRVKGTNNGTITDIDGKFSLNAPLGAEIEVSFVGYQSITVTASKTMSITLAEDSELLDEVVVVGYGTMKKKDLTGAVAAVKGDDIAARRSTQLTTALQGAAAGVMVTRSSGEPGSAASIRVRGVTTISDSSPLVIVDGVPGDINHVNPDDVESLSVLKDAASASIYGSRAAAGVIVITTKHAKTDDLQLAYNFEYGLEIPTNLPKFVSATRYMEMTNELLYNDNPTGGWFQRFTEDDVNNWVKNHETNPDKYPIEDWQSLLIKDSAPRVTHSINISGGSKIVQTKASIRYDKNEGLHANKNYERFMIRINNDIKINKFMDAHLDLNMSRSETVKPNMDPFQIQNMQIPSIYAARWTNGMWGDVKDGANTLARITDGGNNTQWYYRIAGKAGLDISPLKGLKISAVFAPNFDFYKQKQFIKQLPYTFADDPNTIKGYMGDCFTTKLFEQRNDNYDMTSQLFANYAFDIKKHSVTAMVGYEDYYAFWEDLSASRDQYKMTGYPYLSIGPADFRDNAGDAHEYAYRSVFGRLTYSWANRYLLQANVRRDGSSRFASDNRWATFPSFSAGWVVSEEKFIKNLHLNWLSFFKLRGSWGTLGNERIGSYYPYQAALTFNNALFIKDGGVVTDLTAAQTDYAVRDISWETTKTWDFGFDANFLDDRLFVNFDYYKKKTEDMLLPVQIPSFIGFNSPNVNAGVMNTKGFDLEFGWRDHVGDFRYSASFNLSDFVSKMGDMNGTQVLGAQVKMEGSEFNEWYGYMSDGLFLTEEDLAQSPKLNQNTKVGDIKYIDISGPEGKPDGQISPEYDRVLLGGSMPRYMFGANFNASYKGFDFGLVLQGVGKQNARITSFMVEGYQNQWGDFPSLLDGNYWSSTKSAAENATAKYPRLTYSNRSANYGQMSDYWLFNGRYLRLKSLTIGYTLPKSLTQKAFMNNVRVYVSGNDLFCIHNYPKGWDPERSAGTTAGYPITTSLLMGVSVQF